MPYPIQAEHELICPCGCGVVVGEAEPQTQFEEYGTPSHNFGSLVNHGHVYQGLNFLMVDKSLQKSSNWKFVRNKDLQNKERVLAKLSDICKEYGLPERLAFETMRRLLKKNKWFYSAPKQIRELIWTLEDTSKGDPNSILYAHKIKALKTRYETVTGI